MRSWRTLLLHYFLPLLLILVAALSRLIPHPPNVTPIGAMALFGGYYFTSRMMALITVFGAMFLSDLFIGLHGEMLPVYLSFGVSVLLGHRMKVCSSGVVCLSLVVLNSVIFFAVTNFGVWLLTEMYPKNLTGLSACFLAALPFFERTFVGDLFYSALLFGAAALVIRMERERVGESPLRLSR